MKMTKIMLGGLLAITATANAMPTQEETKKVEPLVVDLMKDDQVALKSGKKTRVEVAESAMSLADKADSEAAKLLLIKGAFNLYVRAGEFDKAIETLQALQAAIPDIPPANMASIIESSLRVVPRKNGGQLYRLLDETKLRMRYTSAAKKMEKTLKENPTDRQLRTKLAEHYAYLGKWDQALENFAAADGKVGVIAKSERDGDATEKVADFWWAYPNGKAEELVRAFRAHAAKFYEDAIAAGKITGLNKVQAERRIAEAKEYVDVLASGVHLTEKAQVVEKSDARIIDGKAVIDGCTWSYRVQNGEAVIVSEKDGKFSCAVSPKPAGSISIPSKVNGVKVTSVGREAFVNCGEVMVVKVPEGVTNIAWCAFYGCTNLTTVTLPSTLRNIGHGVFAHCKGLTSVTIPKNVTNIDADAFRFCRGLRSVTIPKGVKSIKRCTFDACESLTSITLPNGLESIGEAAFYNCGKLSKITIPATVTNIDKTAFTGCLNLKTIDVLKDGQAMSVPFEDFAKRWKKL